jgi:hypothetical protein
MAELTGYTQIFSGNTSVVDTVLKQPLGTRGFDGAGNEYIYLTGVVSTADGSWVTYDEAHLTILAVANCVGSVAVAQAAIGASSYGWYMIFGYDSGAKAITAGGCAADKAIYTTSTAGSVDDVKVTGDGIMGAISRVAESGSSGVIGVQLNYPFVDDYDPAA